MIWFIESNFRLCNVGISFTIKLKRDSDQPVRWKKANFYWWIQFWKWNISTELNVWIGTRSINIYAKMTLSNHRYDFYCWPMCLFLSATIWIEDRCEEKKMEKTHSTDGVFAVYNFLRIGQKAHKFKSVKQSRSNSIWTESNVVCITTEHNDGRFQKAGGEQQKKKHTTNCS